MGGRYPDPARSPRRNKSRDHRTPDAKAGEGTAGYERVLVARAVNAEFDDSYPRVRNLLELAWGTQQENQSSGWRRSAPGKLSVGLSTTKSNETQFTRYSRLRYYFVSN